MSVTAADADALGACIDSGGVAIFPADTVYGLAAAPDSAVAVERLYALKGRSAEQPAAVMFFAVASALAALGAVGPRARAAVAALLPGAVTLLLPNPGRLWPLACGPDPDTLGLRVPALPPALAPLRGLEIPLLQSSANVHGGADACRLGDIDPAIRAGADLELDGGELPGIPSTVVDLRRIDVDGTHAVVREGAVPAATVAGALRQR